MCFTKFHVWQGFQIFDTATLASHVATFCHYSTCFRGFLQTSAIWHGRRLNVSFHASLPRTVVFDVSNTIAGPLTAEYGSSFTTGVDPVFMQSKAFIGVSACDNQPSPSSHHELTRNTNKQDVWQIETYLYVSISHRN